MEAAVAGRRDCHSAALVVVIPFQSQTDWLWLIHKITGNAVLL
jgi:hypothetical protein